MCIEFQGDRAFKSHCTGIRGPSLRTTSKSISSASKELSQVRTIQKGQLIRKKYLLQFVRTKQIQNTEHKMDEMIINKGP